MDWVRFGFAAACAYLIVLLVAQALGDYQTYSYRTVPARVGIVREMDRVKKRLLELNELGNALTNQEIEAAFKQGRDAMTLIDREAELAKTGNPADAAEAQKIAVQLREQSDRAWAMLRSKTLPSRGPFEEEFSLLSQQVDSAQAMVHGAIKFRSITAVLEVSIPVGIGALTIALCVGFV